VRLRERMAKGGREGDEEIPGLLPQMLFLSDVGPPIVSSNFESLLGCP